MLGTSRYLWFLTLSYAMALALANWFDPRLVTIFGLTTDAGTIIFPLSFLLSDLITEVYGFKYARRAIWAGFLFNVIFILYGQIVTHLPSPNFPTHNAMFDEILSLSGRIIFASLVSYLISEPLNTYILAKLKVIMKGKKMWVRFVGSTVIASAFDSYIFGTIAFFGLMTNSELVSLILTMWLIKVVIEIVGLPVSLTLAKRLKKAEKIDMYDDKPTFNPFSLETEYSKTSNHFS
jgi:hypothetical protein